MAAITSECLQCQRPLVLDSQNATAAEVRCQHCETLQYHVVYPAYIHDAEVSRVPFVAGDGASCFFHDTARAAQVCDDCGRYLCELCTLPIPMPANSPPEFPTRLCPTCYEHRVEEEQRRPLWDLFQTNYPRYDIMALLLAALPLVLFPLFFLTPITAPVATYIAIRNWRRCRNPVTRFRFYLSIAIGIVLLVSFIWISFIAMAVADVMGMT